jgi:YesN/AraC family two-component response regulator
MTLFTEYLFLTNDQEGFRVCRETRTTAKATMTVLLCEEGFIDVYYHEEMIRIKKNDLFVRLPDFAHELGPYEMSPDFKFKQVTVDSSIYDRLMHDHMRVEPNWWAKQEYIKAHPIFPINSVSIDFFHTYFHLLELQLQDRQTEYRKKIQLLIAKGATMEMLNYIDKLAVIEHTEDERTSVNQSDYTFREFTRLLQQFPHEREVQWYAKQLGITPKYLSEICKERSGKSAGEWIADITVAELKHYLCSTTLPIREIARVMEFPNASFFCQYTKKHTGLTPNHYRREKKNS